MAKVFFRIFMRLDKYSVTGHARAMILPFSGIDDTRLERLLRPAQAVYRRVSRESLTGQSVTALYQGGRGG
jgi:hypothetical protein